MEGSVFFKVSENCLKIYFLKKLLKKLLKEIVLLLNFPVVFEGFHKFWRIFLLFLKDFQKFRQQLLKKLLKIFRASRENCFKTLF